MKPFIHLHLHSPYSFLDGGSSIETLVQRAASLGMPALALTDHNNTAAAVKFSETCRQYHVRPLLGAELTMEDDTHLTLLAQNREGYAQLCGLITWAHAHGGRLTPHLPWSALGILGWEVPAPPQFPLPPSLAEAAPQLDGLFFLSGCRRGLLAWLIRNHRYDEALNSALRLRDALGADRFFLELQDDLTPDAGRINRELVLLANHIGVGVVATNNVHYAVKDDAITHDMLRCVATGTTWEQIHQDRPLNAERYLKSSREMVELFEWCPQALENTLRIAEACEEALPTRSEITPAYPLPEGYADAATYLRYLTIKGGTARYRGLNGKTRARIDHELEVICRLGYEDYFLMCWEIVRWARKQGIRCTGRGSAADSCVAYCLTLTDVDVIQRGLPFARFLTEGKTPDIDMDFPSDRRDDVFRYIVEKYGEGHVGMVCTFHTYWAKGAVRDLGKALSIPAEALEWLSDHLSGFIRADQVDEAFGRYAELRPFQAMKDRFRLLFDLCGRIAGFPRHIATHSSGIVISRVPLSRIAPLQPSARGITQIWHLDKDDAETLGAIKFDVLSLRMLSAVGDAERDIVRTAPDWRYDRIPFDDPATYRMVRAGKAVGAFQFESAAQLALACTLQPEHFEDLVASVALIRPGPIQGHVVSRFVTCRNGWMRADLLHPCLRETLSKTYGCIVFQEQVNDVVAAMTGCSDAEADRFRKSITQHTRHGTMEQLRDEFVRKSCSYRRDFDEERALALWSQIQGWAGYGFTEGHAASFALLGYRTAYLSVHHPAEFYSGEMNHQPMGYYASNSLAAEARRRGVQIRPVDVNQSPDKCYAEAPDAIRLGLRLVSGLREEDIQRIEAARAESPFRSLLDFCSRVVLPVHCVENLILAGAFDSLHEHRRGLLWRLGETLALAHSYRAEAEASEQTVLYLGSASTLETPVAWDVDDFSPWDKYLWTWRLTGVSADCHVFAWMRERLGRKGIMTAYDAQRQKHGARVTVAGLNIRPHRPHTVSGNPVLFTSIEDETEMLQAVALGEVIWETTSIFLTSAAVLARGVIERKGRGVMLRLEKARPLRLTDFISQGEELRVAPPSARTYPGTKLVAT